MLAESEHFIQLSGVYDYLKESIPVDHCRQTSALALAKKTLAEISPRIVVDLGCGAGNSYDFFKAVDSNVEWIGVDIEKSPEVAARVRTDATFVTYDGVHLPFEDGSIDFIYAYQVFEHVRFPELMLKEIHRVLAPNGVLVGQTSQLEPYHSLSLWNFTVYGFKKICEDAGLTVRELRPGVDGNTLFKRTYLGKPKEFSKFFGEGSPFNRKIEREAIRQGKRNQIINHRKLILCGNSVLSAQKCVNADCGPYGGHITHKILPGCVHEVSRHSLFFPSMQAHDSFSGSRISSYPQIDDKPPFGRL